MKNDEKKEHLSMIQQIISRMGQNSFQIKGWSVGIMIAIFSFSGNQNKAICILFTIIPLFVMWFLDSYYLLLERKFRLLYNDVRISKENYNYDMNYNNVKLDVGSHSKISFIKVMFSLTEILFYLTCILTTIFIYVLFK